MTIGKENRMIKISPSVLACDFSRFGEELRKIREAGAQYVHLDVMDGVFVPNISFGIPVVEAARRATDAVLDVHLMIREPEKYAEAFAKAGADIITFHYEATDDASALIDAIHALGKRAGVSVKPATPVSVLRPLVTKADLVLIMTVEPGFGGQKLIPACADKVKELAELCRACGMTPEIEVDGGVTADNVDALIQNGADVIVAGSYVFKASDTGAAVRRLKGEKSDS